MTTREKRKIIRDYIKRNNPHNTVSNLSFDLRGYAKYLEDNNIPQEQQPEVARMFVLDKNNK